MQRPMILSAAEGGMVREESYRGEPYLVAPTALLVEGVHNGDLFLYEEFAAFPGAWNGRPITLRHPIESASSSPECFASAIGVLFQADAREEARTLFAESWLHVAALEAAGELGQDVLARLRQQIGIEVSVGVFARKTRRPGTWHGESYTHINQHIVPDHLALLPDQVGACSWRDGCGTPRLPQALVALCSCGGSKKQQEEQVATPIGLIADTDLRSAVYGALALEMGVAVTPIMIHVVDQDGSFFVIRFGERFLQRSYTRDTATGVVTLGPSYIDVVVTSTYAPSGPEIPAEEITEQMRRMSAYSQTLSSPGGTMENALSAEQLATHIQAHPEMLPQDIQAAIALRSAVRQGWIQTLLSSGVCQFSADNLAARTDHDLQGLLAMAGAVKQASAPATATPSAVTPAAASYALGGVDTPFVPTLALASNDTAKPPSLKDMFGVA